MLVLSSAQMNHYSRTTDELQGTRHAEFLAIAEVLQTYPKSILQSTDLYVTVEPCVMCASALKQYRIRSVYYGCANERFGGTGGVLSLHSESVNHWHFQASNFKLTYDSPSIDPTYPVYGGLFRQEAVMLLRRFYIQENEKGKTWNWKPENSILTFFQHQILGQRRIVN
jgi:tRNA-specific adenosine deaminase 2